MLTKICKCGKKIAVNKSRCDECEVTYTPPQHSKEHREFYSGARWTKLSKVVRTKHPIDLYIYATEGRIVAADMVHHIIPFKERPDLAYVESNLIPLSTKSHEKIESIYRLGGSHKSSMQDELIKIIKKYID